MVRSTGSVTADAADDFLRARRRQAMTRLGRRMQLADADVNAILPFDEVVAALGRVGEVDLGLHMVDLDTIVGTVDRADGTFDRGFLPTSSEVRSRWERIAKVMRRGESLPPISLYRIGEVHFVRDGHHRVSVAKALGLDALEAHVVEVLTRVGATRSLRLPDLPTKGHERLFAERVPLPPAVRPKVRLSDPWRYGHLAESVEAWGFRAMQERHELLDRETVARDWYEQEFVPVARMIREAGLLGRGTDADAYMRVGDERYRLMQTQEWSPAVLARLRDSSRRARAAAGIGGDSSS
jgi:hypothetical protein